MTSSTRCRPAGRRSPSRPVRARPRAASQSGLLAFTTDAADAVRDAERRLGHVRHAGRRRGSRRRRVRRRARSSAAFPHLRRWRARARARRSCRSASVRRLEARLAQRRGTVGGCRFACSPENLRLGKAIEVFTQARPRRRRRARRPRPAHSCAEAARADSTESIEWMSVESAEMTKHASTRSSRRR